VEKAPLLKTLVTCQFQHTSIEEVLGTLQTKYHIAFTYVNNEIPLEKKVSIKLVNVPLDKALDQIFGNSIAYQEIGSQILLKKNEAVVAKEKPVTAKPSRAVLASDSASRQTSKEVKTSNWSWKDLFSFGKKPKQGGGLGAQVPLPKDSAALAKDSIAKAEEQKKRRNKYVKNVLVEDWKYRLGANFTAAYTYRFLNGSDQSVGSRNVIESGSFGYVLGLSFDYKLSGNFYFRTGLDLLKFKEDGLYTLPKEYLPPPPKKAKGFAKDTSISYANNYLFLGIPLMIGYTYGNKWFVSVNTGLEPTLFLTSWTNYPSNAGAAIYPSDYDPNPDVKPPKKPIPKDEEIVGDSSYYYKEYLDARNRSFNRIGLSYLLSVEAGYKIDKRFSLSLSPIFRCFLSSIQSKEDVKEKPYSLGVALAVYYSF